MNDLSYDRDKWYLDGSFFVHRHKIGESQQPHTHDFVEAVYTLHGTCVHTVDGRDYPVRRGDLLFINYHQRHSLTVGGEVEYYDILIKPEAVNDSLRSSENAFSLLSLTDYEDFRGLVNPDNALLRFAGKEREQLEGLLETVAAEQKSTAPGRALMLSCALNILLIRIFRKMSLPMTAEAGRLDRETLSYIDRHCGERLTEKQVAERCHYDPAYFSRSFRRMTGLTFSAYLRHRRLAKARRLLTDTDLPVEAVLLECGYTDRTRFFRDFRQQNGQTPLQFRKSQNQIHF